MNNVILIILVSITLFSCTRASIEINDILIDNIVSEFNNNLNLNPYYPKKNNVLIDSCYAFFSIAEFSNLPKEFIINEKSINDKYFGNCDVNNGKAGNNKGKIFLALSGTNQGCIKVFAYFSEKEINYKEFEKLIEIKNSYDFHLFFYNHNNEITNVYSDKVIFF